MGRMRHTSGHLAGHMRHYPEHFPACFPAHNPDKDPEQPPSELSQGFLTASCDISKAFLRAAGRVPFEDHKISIRYP